MKTLKQVQTMRLVLCALYADSCKHRMNSNV